MKVKELITELLEFNLNAEVTLTTSEDIQLSYINGTGDNEFDKASSPVVFIEGCNKYDYHNCAWIDKEYCTFYNKDCALIKECYAYEEDG